MSRPSSSGSSEHRSALSEGTRLHNYTLERVLGAGGFGITYMARESITERAVAIKEYLPSSLAVRERDGMTVQPVSESSRQDYEWGLTRFRQEAKLLLGLRHDNIVPSLNYFEANGTAYLVMGYQEGQTLAQVTAGALTLEESEVRDFLEPLLDGVEAVHRAGLLHRDIKPDNIFIRTDGTPVLIDFGSARQALGNHSQSLTAVVTDGYAPFEQYERGGDQGPWTDIYSIGAVLFRCMVGHRPPTSTKRLSAQYRGSPDPAAQGFATLRQRASKQLARAIEGALMVSAEDRPQSIADFRALLADTGARATMRRQDAANPTLLAGTRPGTYAPESAMARSGESHLTISAEAPKRRRALPIYAGLAVLLLAGGAAAAYLGVGGIDIPGYTLNSPSEQKRLADEEARRKAAEEAKRRAADEEAKRRADDEKRRLEEEAKRRADDDAKKRADEDAKRRADDAKRRAEDEAKRTDAQRRADEEKRRADEEKRRADEDAKRRRDEEAKRRADEDSKRTDAQRRADEEKRRGDEEKRRADEDAKRRAAEDSKRRADEDAKRRADEELKSAAARPSFYAAERNRGLIYFPRNSAALETSAWQALQQLLADARAGNARITLTAVSESGEPGGAEGARLRVRRLESIRAWLVERGIAPQRIRIAHQPAQGDGAQYRYVIVSLEEQPGSPGADRPGADRPGADRPGADRPGTGRPGTDRPGTGEPERKYSQAELTLMMYRLLKGAAMSTNIKTEGDAALASGADVSGLAVCVNWAATTPDKASINGAYIWNSRTGTMLHERALRGCQQMSRPNCECVVVDVGGGNALRLPPAFAQKYARQ